MPRNNYSEEKLDDMRHYVRYENGQNLRCDEGWDCDDRRDCDDECCDKREKKHCDDDHWDFEFDGRCHPSHDHKQECCSHDKSCCMCNCPSVCEALRIANATGQQVNIGLKSGKVLEGVIIERLWPTSFRVWLEPAEPVEQGEDIDKAIVAIHAVDSVNFNLQEDLSIRGYFEDPDKCCLEGIREALEFALLTNQSVNVAINKEEESTKVEGFIKKVCCETFSILSEETEMRETIKIDRVEYVEYS